MIKQYPIIMDCVWETFEDTVTWMIVDNVGILSHRSHKKPKVWQKITVKELRPSTFSPLIPCLIVTTDKENDSWA